jgi:hypothetical protein
MSYYKAASNPNFNRFSRCIYRNSNTNTGTHTTSTSIIIISISIRHMGKCLSA